MNLTYTRVGNYLLPNIVLSEPPSAESLGKYGRMRKAYLKKWHSILYSKLLLTARLYPLCREIDEAAKSRLALGMSDSEILTELVYGE